METKLVFRGGIDLELTPLTNKGGWSNGNLVRFRSGQPEKRLGWVAVSDPLDGVCRGLHFWSDLTGLTYTAAGTTTNLFLIGQPNLDITPFGYVPGPVSSGAMPFSLRIWSLDNFGQDLIAIPSGGPVYLWVPPDTATRAAAIIAAPAKSQGGFVASQLQIIMAYGCTPLLGGNQDPMLVRWCDQGNFNDWTASTTNQAGSYRLPRGNRIVGGMQTTTVGLLWTDFSLYAASYIGFPLVFSFTEIGENNGLIAQMAKAMAGTVPYWMSDHGFFRMGGGAAEQIPCSVWDFVFKDLDEHNQDKCIAALDYHYSEIMFFFPSDSGGTGEIDSYVSLNIAENLWDCGRLIRTGWTDSNRPGHPLGVDEAGIVMEHDTSVDANGAPMTGVFVQSGFVDVEDGGAISLINRVIPDFLWQPGSAPDASLDISFLFRNYPGETPTTAGPFTITQQTQFVTLTSLLADGVTPAVGVRAREIAIRISSDGLGVFWRCGTNRVRGQPDGRL